MIAVRRPAQAVAVRQIGRPHPVSVLVRELDLDPGAVGLVRRLRRRPIHEEQPSPVMADVVLAMIDVVLARVLVRRDAVPARALRPPVVIGANPRRLVVANGNLRGGKRRRRLRKISAVRLHRSRTGAIRAAAGARGGLRILVRSVSPVRRSAAVVRSQVSAVDAVVAAVRSSASAVVAVRSVASAVAAVAAVPSKASVVAVVVAAVSKLSVADVAVAAVANMV